MKETNIISCRREDGTAVVSFQLCRINELEMAERFGRELQALLDQQDLDRLVVDCANLDYAISETFSILIHAANQLKKRNAQMVTCNLSPFLKDVYITMRLDATIPICGSLEEALRK